MDALLMHKEIPVVDIVFDEESSVILGIGTIHNSEHLPIGIPEHNGVADRAEFNSWWTERSIPASRSGIKDALEELGIPNLSKAAAAHSASSHSMRLSLPGLWVYSAFRMWITQSHGIRECPTLSAKIS